MCANCKALDCDCNGGSACDTANPCHRARGVLDSGRRGDGCIVRLVAIVDPTGGYRIETGLDD